jgi:hypothetical protein
VKRIILIIALGLILSGCAGMYSNGGAPNLQKVYVTAEPKDSSITIGDKKCTECTSMIVERPAKEEGDLLKIIIEKEGYQACEHNMISGNNSWKALNWIHVAFFPYLFFVTVPISYAVDNSNGAGTAWMEPVIKTELFPDKKCKVFVEVDREFVLAEKAERDRIAREIKEKEEQAARRKGVESLGNSY